MAYSNYITLPSRGANHKPRWHGGWIESKQNKKKMCSVLLHSRFSLNTATWRLQMHSSSVSNECHIDFYRDGQRIHETMSTLFVQRPRKCHFSILNVICILRAIFTNTILFYGFTFGWPLTNRLSLMTSSPNRGHCMICFDSNRLTFVCVWRIIPFQLT